MQFVSLILGIILFVGGIVFQVVSERKIVKNRSITHFRKEEWLKVGGSAGALGLGTLLLLLSAFLFHPTWVEERGGHLAMALIGGFIFGFALSTLISGFAFRYWNSALDEKTKKDATKALLASILPLLIGFLVFMEGVAPYLSYPLISGLTFKDGKLVAYHAGESTGSFHIAWYGLIILSGVAVCYAICDHQFYKKYKKHGILDNLVLVAFPAGIIGARIWYVVGNWNRMFAGRPFGQVFAIWDGGLTILGGAFLGIVAGVAFMLIRRKYVNIWFAVDICVPTILLAQAIGRWGNFFNCEVYGQAVALSNGWQWLPTWIANQMHISNSGAALDAGMIHVPLFLIESLINIGGYFLIAYGIGKGLKKWIVGGDLCAAYFIFYGLVRIIMEPMRDTEFNMGSDNSWSVVNSLIYILIGLILVALVHLNAYRKKENAKRFIIPLLGGSGALLASFFLFLPSLSAGIVHSSSNVELQSSYKGFELLFSGNDIIHLVAWIFGLLGSVLLLASIFLKKKENHPKNVLILPAISAAFLLISAIIFIGGSSWTRLPKEVSGTELSYSMSYGYCLYGFFALFGVMMAFLMFLPELIKWKKTNKEEVSDD